MKSLFLALAAVLTFNMAYAQNVSSYILELEAYTKWDAVESTWKTQRSTWVANVKPNNKPLAVNRVICVSSEISATPFLFNANLVMPFSPNFDFIWEYDINSTG